MTAYDITVTVEGAGSSDDVGSRLLAGLAAEGLDAVVSHDTTSAQAELVTTVTATDLAAAAAAGIAAVQMACAEAGLVAADVVSVTAAPARASSPAAA